MKISGDSYQIIEADTDCAPAELICPFLWMISWGSLSKKPISYAHLMCMFTTLVDTSPKKKILWSFTHTHVVPKPKGFCHPQNTNENIWMKPERFLSLHWQSMQTTLWLFKKFIKLIFRRAEMYVLRCLSFCLPYFMRVVYMHSSMFI